MGSVANPRLQFLPSTARMVAAARDLPCRCHHTRPRYSYARQLVPRSSRRRLRKRGEGGVEPREEGTGGLVAVDRSRRRSSAPRRRVPRRAGEGHWKRPLDTYLAQDSSLDCIRPSFHGS